jgi:hypothetical protein
MNSINYQNNLIYKIFCIDPNISDIFIGSTTLLDKVILSHKYKCRDGHPGKLYSFIRQNGGWDNWTHEIIELYPCQNKEEANKKLQEYIQELKPTLNKPQLIRDKKWRKEYNKDYFVEKAKAKMYYCEACKCDMKFLSKCSHNRSYYHLASLRRLESMKNAKCLNILTDPDDVHHKYLTKDALHEMLVSHKNDIHNKGNIASEEEREFIKLFEEYQISKN